MLQFIWNYHRYYNKKICKIELYSKPKMLMYCLFINANEYFVLNK